MKYAHWVVSLSAIACSLSSGFAATAAADDRHMFLTGSTSATPFGTNGIKTFDAHPPGVTSEDLTDVDILSDTKLVVCGPRTLNGLRRFQIKRLLTDGTSDPAFAGGGSAYPTWGTLSHEDPVAIAGSIDKTVVIGNLRYSDGKSAVGVVQLTASGAVDMAFGTNGLVTFHQTDWNFYAGDVMLLPSGKILIVATAYRPSDGDYRFHVHRLNANGTMDTTFDPAQLDGTKSILFSGMGVTTLKATSIDAYMPSGEGSGWISVAGIADDGTTNGRYAVALLTHDGALYNTFNTTGTKLFKHNGVQVRSKVVGRLDNIGRIALGTMSDAYLAVARVRADGSMDVDFSSDGFSKVSASGRFVDLLVRSDNSLDALITTSEFYVAVGFSADGQNAFPISTNHTPLNGYSRLDLSASDILKGSPDRVIRVGALINP